MTESYFALIAEEEYPAFRHLMKDPEFPETFAQWDHRQKGRKDFTALQFQPGGMCVDVKVTANEFRRHCETTQSHYTLESLDRYASEKGNQGHSPPTATQG